MTNSEASRIISDKMGKCWHDPIFVDDGMYYKCKLCGVNNYHYFLRLDAFSAEGFVECLEWAMDDSKHEWKWETFFYTSANNYISRYGPVGKDWGSLFSRLFFNSRNFGMVLAEWLVFAENPIHYLQER